MSAPASNATARARAPLDRTDMAERQGESWRPPSFSAPLERPLVDKLRRFFDLQAGTIWHDLAAQLPLVNGNVLDVGCGAQPYRPLFGPNARYRGIDTADAKSHFGYEVPDTTYFEGDVWPVEDASIDFVLCTEALEHVTDPRRFLAEAARCLKPGGRIILTAPFAARWHHIPHDYWRYTPSSLVMLFSEAGFVDTAVYARGNPVTVASYKAMAVLLPALMPQGQGPLKTGLLRLFALPLAPCLVPLAIVGNLSLLGRGGDDCLGYTVLSRRAG